MFNNTYSLSRVKISESIIIRPVPSVHQVPKVPPVSQIYLWNEIVQRYYSVKEMSGFIFNNYVYLVPIVHLVYPVPLVPLRNKIDQRIKKTIGTLYIYFVNLGPSVPLVSYIPQFLRVVSFPKKIFRWNYYPNGTIGTIFRLLFI